MEDVTEQQHLLPAAVDHRAKHTPEKIYAALPKGDRLEDGFFDLTYTAFARAIDAAAWWLDSVLGAKSAKTKFDELATVPYVGPDDFRYGLFIHAAMKTGRKVMYPFPANTPEGLVRLLELSNSEVVLASVCHKHIWTEPLMLKPEIRLIEVPEICEFVHDKHVEPYLYERTMAEGIDDAQMLIQTSGTTSHPKPIVLNNRWTKEYLEDVALLGKRNGIILVPDMLRHLVRDPEARQSLKLYDWVGDHGFYMDYYSDDLYELCTKRQQNDPRHVPAIDVFHTRDLWRAAPGRGGFWMNAGRVDDFVKLSTMTKFNAIAIEQIVEANPIVAKCVIAGDSRKKAFILVEPSP
ncbi:hypothetical protein B0A55_09937 [Friedmanniomyces simplex]|uniref:Uncharacterized protein n=1 Tax=Friedmanniomyces simplex TaxID=329884 RepID=A0A4U0X020_9PEZI|nr:hypothetical protein B0A55_09937 [Friedmanniomyces simplex]